MAMDHDRFTKNERRQMRELVGRAHDEEARRLLQELDGEFDRWRRGEIDHFELIDAIHKFHDRDSREMWKTYNNHLRSEPLLVARAVVMGLLPREAVPEGLRGRVPTWLWEEEGATGGAAEDGEPR